MPCTRQRKENISTNINQYDQFVKERKENNNQFEDSIIVDSRYNRMLCFDSHHLHKANGFIDNKRKDKRLTLITFFYDINYNGERKMRYPLNETRQQD